MAEQDLSHLGVTFTSKTHRNTYAEINPATNPAPCAGKTVLVTGAAKGIGRATIVAYAGAGASRIAITGRGDASETHAEAVRAAAEAGRGDDVQFPVLRLDAQDRASVERCAAELRAAWGHVDVLVNNAGDLAPFASLGEGDGEDWWKLWEVNLRGVYWVTQVFLPLVLESADKTVVNMVSVGALALMPGAGSYQVSKFAVIRFPLGLVSPGGINKVSIHPSGIFLGDAVGQQSPHADRRQDHTKAVEMHEMVDADVHATQLTTMDRSVRPTEPPGDDDLLARAILGRDETSTAENVGELPAHNIAPIDISKSLTIRLYTSHFLSTWNSRLFEAAVVYFLASIFPDNLLPVSVYALTRNVVAIALTVPVGNWIDRAHRLTIVRTSIIGQRVAVAASCGLFWVMLERPLSTEALGGLFAATVILACIEKLSAGVNLVSVERDWVVVITEGNEAARRIMNARMRRIDLFCKLLGPLTVALIAAAFVPAALCSTLGMNLASVPVEYLCIETVFRRVPTLRRSAGRSTRQPPEGGTHQEQSRQQSPYTAFRQRLQRMASQILSIPSLRLYFGHPAVIPSFTLSLLYLTVLSFSGQMLTYLLASNVNFWQVGIIRGVSTIFELSATWIAPRLMKRIGVIRTGLWSISWQMTWLAGGVLWFFYYYGRGYPSTSIMPAAGLAAAVAFSRVGLWGFDLSAQNIVQDEVQGNRRGIFSTVETSFQNVFDLLSWALTIIWSDPNSFQWPVLISFATVYMAGGLYASFLRRRRGHLIHAPSCLSPKVDV